MDGPERPGGVGTLDEVLAHYGVKGMHWGVRGGKGTPTASHPTSADAQAVATSRDKVKAGGTKTLSTKELQELVTRMNLEQQFANLSANKGTIERGHGIVKKVLAIADTGAKVYNTINSPAGKALKKLLTSA